MELAKETSSTLENNQILLNAIRRKFTTNNDERTEGNPIKLTVPTLDINKVATTTTTTNKLNTMCSKSNSNDSKSNRLAEDSTNKLSAFLREQLSEKRLNGELTTAAETTNANNGFILPQLQFNLPGSSKPALSTSFVLPNLSKRAEETPQTAAGFIVPKLNTAKTANAVDAAPSSSVKAISNAFTQLSINNNVNDATTIDLTTALSLTNQHERQQKSAKAHAKPAKTTEEFYIPFVDCDMPESSPSKLNLSLGEHNTNEYCQTDVSNMIYLHSLVQPSAFGRVICLNYKRRTPLRRASLIVVQKFKAKQKIQPFRFDTQSPDDKVLAAMSKYHRQNI